jgi:hypothetical protein
VIARAARSKAILLCGALLLSACAGQGEIPQTALRSSPVIRTTLPDPDAPAPPPLGTEEEAIRAEYGAPDFVRNEIDSRLWRYDGSDCALFFFLYREADVYILRHAETNPAGADSAVDSNCLGRIKAAHGPSS